jgi:hypothetical protein
MDYEETVFEAHLLSAEKWVRKARELKLVADEMKQLAEPFNQALLEAITKQREAEEKPAAWRAATEVVEEVIFKQYSILSAVDFFYGLALENACKARLIAEGQITIREGKPKGLRSDHNILEMVRSCAVTLSPKEVEFLSTLSAHVRTWAKYPITKNADSLKGSLKGGVLRISLCGSGQGEQVDGLIQRVLARSDLLSYWRARGF